MATARDLLTWDVKDVMNIKDAVESVKMQSTAYGSDVQWTVVLNPTGKSYDRRVFIGLDVQMLEGASVVVDWSVFVVPVGGRKVFEKKFTMKSLGSVRSMSPWFEVSNLEKVLVQQDTLHLVVSISYKMACDTLMYRKFMRSLSALIDDSSCDYKLIVEGKVIGVHTKIMRLRLPYFDRLVEAKLLGVSDKQMIVEGHSYATMKKLVEFLYTGIADVDPLSAPDLMKAANVYELQDLATECSSAMKLSLLEN